MMSFFKTIPPLFITMGNLYGRGRSFKYNPNDGFHFVFVCFFFSRVNTVVACLSKCNRNRRDGWLPKAAQGSHKHYCSLFMTMLLPNKH